MNENNKKRTKYETPIADVMINETLAGEILLYISDSTGNATTIDW